jgi:hypothetical protein
MTGAVALSGLWPDLASLGLGVLAMALGTWFVVSEQLERQRQYSVDYWRFRIGYSGPGLPPEPPVGSLPAATLAELSSFPPAEREESTGAEEILAASPGPVADGFVAACVNLVEGTHRATGGHRWIQFAATACVVLLLIPVAVALFVPLLLVMVFSYVSDTGHDFRLRLIVWLFLADIALQTIAHL